MDLGKIVGTALLVGVIGAGSIVGYKFCQEPKEFNRTLGYGSIEMGLTFLGAAGYALHRERRRS